MSMCAQMSYGAQVVDLPSSGVHGARAQKESVVECIVPGPRERAGVSSAAYAAIDHPQLKVSDWRLWQAPGAGRSGMDAPSSARSGTLRRWTWRRRLPSRAEQRAACSREPPSVGSRPPAYRRGPSGAFTCAQAPPPRLPRWGDDRSVCAPPASYAREQRGSSVVVQVGPASLVAKHGRPCQQAHLFGRQRRHVERSAPSGHVRRNGGIEGRGYR